MDDDEGASTATSTARMRAVYKSWLLAPERHVYTRYESETLDQTGISFGEFALRILYYASTAKDPTKQVQAPEPLTAAGTTLYEEVQRQKKEDPRTDDDFVKQTTPLVDLKLIMDSEQTLAMWRDFFKISDGQDDLIYNLFMAKMTQAEIQSIASHVYTILGEIVYEKWKTTPRLFQEPADPRSAPGGHRTVVFEDVQVEVLASYLELQRVTFSNSIEWFTANEQTFAKRIPFLRDLITFRYDRLRMGRYLTKEVNVVLTRVLVAAHERPLRLENARDMGQIIGQVAIVAAMFEEETQRNMLDLLSIVGSQGANRLTKAVLESFEEELTRAIDTDDSDSGEAEFVEQDDDGDVIVPSADEDDDDEDDDDANSWIEDDESDPNSALLPLADALDDAMDVDAEEQQLPRDKVARLKKVSVLSHIQQHEMSHRPWLNFFLVLKSRGFDSEHFARKSAIVEAAGEDPEGGMRLMLASIIEHILGYTGPLQQLDGIKREKLVNRVFDLITADEDQGTVYDKAIDAILEARFLYRQKYAFQSARESALERARRSAPLEYAYAMLWGPAVVIAGLDARQKALLFEKRDDDDLVMEEEVTEAMVVPAYQWEAVEHRYESSFHLFRVINLKYKLGLLNIDYKPAQKLPSEWTQWRPYLTSYNNQTFDESDEPSKEQLTRLQCPNLLFIDQLYLCLGRRWTSQWDNIAEVLGDMSSGSHLPQNGAWWHGRINVEDDAYYPGWYQGADLFEKVLNGIEDAMRQFLHMDDDEDAKPPLDQSPEAITAAAKNLVASTAGVRDPYLFQSIVLSTKRMALVDTIIGTLFSKSFKRHLKNESQGLTLCAAQPNDTAFVQLLEIYRKLGVQNLTQAAIRLTFTALDIPLDSKNKFLHKGRRPHSCAELVDFDQWSLLEYLLARIMADASMNAEPGALPLQLPEDARKLEPKSDSDDDSNSDDDEDMSRKRKRADEDERDNDDAKKARFRALLCKPSL